MSIIENKWIPCTLGDIIDIKHGFAFQGEFFHDGPLGDILLTPGNFAIGGGFKADKFKYYLGPVPEEYILNDGDLLVTMTDLSKESDTLGYPATIPKSFGPRFLHNQRLGKILIKDTNHLYRRFLYYLLCTKEYRQEVISSATGTTVKHTSPNRIMAFNFFLPPIEEQYAIARILGSLDDKIELNRQMNETLEAMARAIFQSWFVDFDPVRAKAEGRDTGLRPEIAALFPDQMNETIDDYFPKGWKVHRLGDVVEVVDMIANGCFAEIKENVHLLDHIDYAIFVRTTDFNCKNFSRKLKYINKKDYDFLKKTQLFGNEVLISNVGNAGVVFRPPIWLKKPMVLGNNAIAIRNSDYYNFIYHYFLNKKGSDQLRSIITGSVQMKFNKTDFRNLRVIFPPKDVILKFNDLVSSINKKQILIESENYTLAQIRDALLPKLMSGEIRVEAES
jgi:type I restriction enzyme S subunit